MSPWIWLLALVSMTGLDLAVARYTGACAAGKRWAAVWWAVIWHVAGTVVALAAVEDVRYVSATLLGTAIGTALGVKPKPAEPMGEA